MKQQTRRGSRMFRRAFLSGVVVTGAGLGASGVAQAASGAGSGTAASSTAPSGSGTSGTNSRPGAPAAGVPPNDPATMAHGPGESLLTGTDLQTATTAAEAAVPGATVMRAETDSSGASPYEVHMKKADGSYVTVELDSTFHVVRTIDGFGAGPSGTGPQPRASAAPAGAAPAAA